MMMLSILMDHDTEVQFLNRQLQEKTIAQDEKLLLEQFYEFRKSLRKYRRKQKPYLIPRTEEEMLAKLQHAKFFLIEKHEKSEKAKLSYNLPIFL